MTTLTITKSASTVSSSSDTTIAKSESQSSNTAEEVEDCCICAEKPLHPIKLPCRHIFCFLCVKGCYLTDQKCPLCRTHIPQKFINSPEVLGSKARKRRSKGDASSSKKKKPSKSSQPNFAGSVAADSVDIEMIPPAEVWFYHGRNGGWWQYDERTNAVIDKTIEEQKSSVEVTLAGKVYVLDLVGMEQLLKDDPSIKRKMKKDLQTADAKGIAGIKQAKTIQID